MKPIARQQAKRRRKKERQRLRNEDKLKGRLST